MARKSKSQVSELASLVPSLMSTSIDDGGQPAIDYEKPARKAKSAGLRFIINKDFKPRTDNIGDGSKGKFAQIHNWNALVSMASMSEDGTFSYEEAVAAIQHAAEVNGYTATANARGFVQGRVRGEHIITA